MNVTPARILKLVLEDDTCPVDQWLSSVRDKTLRARISRQIDKMERGNFGDHKDVGKGVSELRLFFGPGYRVYYGRIENTIVVLLGGGDKATQSADIARAQELWRAFQEEGRPDAALLAWLEAQQAGTSDMAVQVADGKETSNETETL